MNVCTPDFVVVVFCRLSRRHGKCFHGKQDNMPQKVLIVISDKKSDSTDDEIDKAVTPLRENDVVIIPVAFGNEADKVQLVKLVDDESTLVTADTNNDTTDIKDEIMIKFSKVRGQISLENFFFGFG